METRLILDFKTFLTNTIYWNTSYQTRINQQNFDLDRKNKPFSKVAKKDSGNFGTVDSFHSFAITRLR